MKNKQTNQVFYNQQILWLNKC